MRRTYTIVTEDGRPLIHAENPSTQDLAKLEEHLGVPASECAIFNSSEMIKIEDAALQEYYLRGPGVIYKIPTGEDAAERLALIGIDRHDAEDEPG